MKFQEKKVEVNKQTAVAYIKSDIETLREQSETTEISAYVNRIRAGIGLLLTLKVIQLEEASSLEDQEAEARKTAAARVPR